MEAVSSADAARGRGEEEEERRYGLSENKVCWTVLWRRMSRRLGEIAGVSLESDG